MLPFSFISKITTRPPTSEPAVSHQLMSTAAACCDRPDFSFWPLSAGPMQPATSASFWLWGRGVVVSIFTLRGGGTGRQAGKEDDQRIPAEAAAVDYMQTPSPLRVIVFGCAL